MLRAITLCLYLSPLKAGIRSFWIQSTLLRIPTRVNTCSQLLKIQFTKSKLNTRPLLGVIVTDSTANVKKFGRRDLSATEEHSDILTYGCAAHLLNLLAQDVKIDNVTGPVMEIVKYSETTMLPQICIRKLDDLCWQFRFKYVGAPLQQVWNFIWRTGQHFWVCVRKIEMQLIKKSKIKWEIWGSRGTLKIFWSDWNQSKWLWIELRETLAKLRTQWKFSELRRML